jgi:hypothetical protein
MRCTGAVSRHKPSRSQKFIMVQDFNCVQMSVSGCKSVYQFFLVQEPSKNRDKLIKHTDRVMCRGCLKIYPVKPSFY